MIANSAPPNFGFKYPIDPAPILAELGRADAPTKQSIERLSLLLRATPTMRELSLALRHANEAIQREARHSFGDPIQKLIDEPWKKAYWSGLARRLIGGGLTAEEKEVHDLLGQKSLGEDSGLGSALVIPAVATDLYSALWSSGEWRHFGVIPMGGPNMKFVVLTARPNAIVQLTEGSALTDDTATTAVQVSGDCEVIVAYLLISLQWLNDTQVELSTAFLQHFVEAVNKRLEYLCLSATGAADSTNGGMTGGFVHADSVVLNAAAGNTTVQTIDRADLVNTIAAVSSAALQRQSRWFIHPTLLPPLMNVADAGGHPVLETVLETGGGDTLLSMLGFGVSMSEGCPSTNSASQKVLAFCDPKSLAIGVRKEFGLDGSSQARWNTLQAAFRGYMRARTEMRRGAAWGILRTAAA